MEHRFVQRSANAAKDLPIPDSHIISPCYRSNKPIECKHNECPYVIAHSIYLWVGRKRGALHKAEFSGVGCVYAHTNNLEGHVATLEESASPEFMNARAYALREKVFHILDMNYGDRDLIESSPSIVIDIIRQFYNEIIRGVIQHEPSTLSAFSARDITSGLVTYVRVYKSSDADLFLMPEKDEDESRVETEPVPVKSPIIERKKIVDDVSVFMEIESVRDGVKRDKRDKGRKSLYKETTDL
jgi:hypothetical protein